MVQFPTLTVVQLLIPFAILLATVLLLLDLMVVASNISRPFTLMLLTSPLLLPLTVMLPGLAPPVETVIVVDGTDANLTLLNTALPGVESIAL